MAWCLIRVYGRDADENYSKKFSRARRPKLAQRSYSSGTAYDELSSHSISSPTATSLSFKTSP